MSVLWKHRLATQAELDFFEIIGWTIEKIGERQAETYAETMSLAIEALYDGPEQMGVKARDDIGPVLEITFNLDNVSREIVGHLDTASESQSVIEETYRPYLSTELAGLQVDPPIHMVWTETEAEILRVTERALILNAGNKAFSGISQTATTFAGLA